MSRRTPTMHEVAALARVSQRTVSNVINDYAHVRPETRARVQAAIDELNYRPNLSARRLRGGRTGLVAFAVPEIAAPYFAELADLIQRTAERHGLTMLVDQTGGQAHNEREVVDGYHAHVIDGLILSPLALTADDLEREESGVPTVLLGERISGTRYLHVSIDNETAAAAATRLLLEGGAQRVAVLGAREREVSMNPEGRRLRGYLDALEEAGVPAPAELRLRCDPWSRVEGFEATRAALAAGIRFDALFCFNDALALGALRALREAGLSVPHDVAVIGWDDVEEASFSHPALSTVAPDKRFIAERAVEQLVRTIAGEAGPGGDVVAPFSLIRRASTR